MNLLRSKEILFKKIFLLIFLLIISIYNSHGNESKDHKENLYSSSFNRALTTGAVGESSTLYLNNQKNTYFFNLMNNDFLGNTDKYLTGSMKIGFEEKRGKTDGFATTLYWRALTPNFKDDKNGLFADWLEWETSFSSLSLKKYGLFRNYFNIGISHLGDKKIDNVQRFIHNKLGLNISNINYTGQPQKFDFISLFEVGSGLILKPVNIYNTNLETMISISGRYAKDISYIAATSNFLLTFNRFFAMALEIKLSSQLASKLHYNFTSTREEFGLGFRIYKYYRPTFRYISPYQKGDNIRQIYIDAINFTYSY